MISIRKVIHTLAIASAMFTLQVQAEESAIYRRIDLSKLPGIYESASLDAQSLKKILSRLETIDTNYDIIRYSDDAILLTTALLSLGITCGHIPTESKNADKIFIACSFANFRRMLLERGVIDPDQLLKFSDDHFKRVEAEFRKVNRSPNKTEFIFFR